MGALSIIPGRQIVHAQAPNRARFRQIVHAQATNRARSGAKSYTLRNCLRSKFRGILKKLWLQTPPEKAGEAGGIFRKKRWSTTVFWLKSCVKCRIFTFYNCLLIFSIHCSRNWIILAADSKSTQNFGLELIFWAPHELCTKKKIGGFSMYSKIR